MRSKVASVLEWAVAYAGGLALIGLYHIFKAGHLKLAMWKDRYVDYMKSIEG